MLDEPDEAHPHRPGRGRTIAATVLAVLAVIVLVIALVAVWAEATVLRSESVARLAGDALDEPDVQAALAAHLADRVDVAVDLEARLADRLPASLDRLAAPIAAAADAAVERAFTVALAEPAVQDVVTTLVERAHARALRLLRGDGLVDGITVVDGSVSVNLLPLVERGLTSLQGLGLLDGVEVPELAPDGDPAEQVDRLSAALGRDLPEDFGQLTVYESDDLADAQATVQAAQRLLVLAERAVWVLVVLAVVLVAAAMVVAPRRGRAALALALGLAAAMIVLRTAARRMVVDAEDLARLPGGKAAIRAVVGGATDGLLHLAGVVLLVALTAVAVIVLTRRRWLDDLVPVGAVLLGAATVAAVGLTPWGLVLGLVAGVAVPVVARRLTGPATG